MTSTNWRHKCYNAPISKMISIADEEMAMLLMENNALDLKEIKRTRQKLERLDQKSKHAKIDKEGDSGESFQGWHKKGTKRFNVLHKAVKESRLLRSSIEMEEELMAKYHAIYGKKRCGARDRRRWGHQRK